MLRVTLRNLVARKLRLVMSAFAIVLGVAFVSGSLIFTDAMGGAFDDIVEGSVSDVEVAHPGAIDFNALDDNRTIKASVADDIAALPEVGSVHPYMQLLSVFVVGKDGKTVGGNGPPGLAFNYSGSHNLKGDEIISLQEGEWPSEGAQVAIDTGSAEKAGYEVGDQVTLVTPGREPLMKAELTGLLEFGNGGLVGATITVFERQFMQEQFFGGRDVYIGISVDGKDGVSQRDLADAVSKVVPKKLEVRTGDVVVEENKEGIDNAFLKYIRIFMLVFAGISLVVGAFLIINTFSILVAQRSRELALLRALGASRPQVVGAVLLEALVVGFLGSTLGLFVGMGLAQVIRAGLASFGLDLSEAAFPVRGTTVMWCYVLGMLVTVIAALLPALRGSKAAPVSALRDDVALPEATIRTRLLIGALMVVGGAASIGVGFASSSARGLSLVGLGLFLVLIGVSLMSPLLSRPVIATFGVAYRRLFGSIGQLATQNSTRNPRRTAATSSALMIGIALVAMVSIFAQSAAASTDEALEESLRAELVVSNIVAQPFSPALADQIREVRGVHVVAQVQQVFAKADGDSTVLAGVDPRTIQLAVDMEVLEGDLAQLKKGTVAVADNTAKGHDFEVGDRVSAEFQGGVQKLRVVAIFKNDPALAQASYLVTPATLQAGGLEQRDTLLYVVKAPNADLQKMTEAVIAITEKVPTLTTKDPGEFADEQRGQVNQFLALIYSLLGLSVVIAVLGVINTLGLSVIERTREVGLLRAVGVSRGQLRTMIRLEAIVIAVLGGLLGVMMGLAFGISLVKALADQGITELTIPWGSLASFVVASGLVGVLAAVWPGRRAARLDVL
ncbi:MAG TPA: FtsX-like permease family protein, partial [Nocardioidaceae bacterium]|nr:FtsX-like permease family protein [Nocardioidaceae bacterium]